MGIVDTPDKKGFTVVYKKPRSIKKPAKSTVRCTMKAGARRSLHKLKRLLTKNKYRVDLSKVNSFIIGKLSVWYFGKAIITMLYGLFLGCITSCQCCSAFPKAFTCKEDPYN